MRKILGFPVLATGLALALNVYNPEVFKRAAPVVEPLDIESLAFDATAPAPVVPSVQSEAATKRETASTPQRSFAPGAKFAAAAARYRPRAVATAAKLPRQVALAEPPRETATVAVHEVTVAPWRTSVTPTPVVQPGAGMTSPKPSDPASRYELVVQIQRELKRVGCYDGRLDGSWGYGSQRALAAFMERVNAALPTVEPDYILLALITNQSRPVCGAQCPTGQSLAGDGRCVPSAILAQATRKGPSPTTTRQMAWVAEVTPTGAVTAPQAAGTIAAPPAAPLPGRMAVGGPTLPPPLPVPAVQGREQVTVALADGDAPLLGPDGMPLDPAGAGAGALSVPVIAAAPPVDKPKRNRANRDSDGERSYGRRRNVQNLFTHPLGNM